ncbi:hypothetical protein D7D52_15355 [Nocardia yunnanensis]|uniref:Uncharacterized protein n=1 Tax=Nocardia yunnanensis TaxID=2382165 RepID=A0A386ZEU1_9NOCA|nr:hypothetical protein [Nocardia yunnanensis]AYF75009.1 hypothetical protein D7D52_15355 [Nocardia yunnanensis]
MKKSVLARSGASLAGAVAVAGLAVAMAPAASAQLAITSSTAYCADTTYTVTFPAADAAAMASQYGASTFVLEATNTTGNLTWWSAPVTATSGQDVTFQWTPSAAVPANGSAVGSWNLYVTESGVAAAAAGPLAVTVVQTAPSGTTCTPSTLGTGSANMTVGALIGNLLSSLSAAAAQ